MREKFKKISKEMGLLRINICCMGSAAERAANAVTFLECNMSRLDAANFPKEKYNLLK